MLYYRVMAKHIGVTGTRTGMNERQFEFIAAFLANIVTEERYFHHGDCIGVDVEVAQMAKNAGFIVIGHPPTNPTLRGYFENHETLPTKDYLARNRDIVDASELLLVVPKEMEPVLRSGTWSTQRYAAHNKKSTIIVWPESNIRFFPTTSSTN